MSIKPCCQAPEHRETEHDTPTLTVERCRICQCRHYVLRVDPVRVGVEGGQL